MALLTRIGAAALLLLGGCGTIKGFLGGTKGTGPTGADAASALPDD